MLCAQRAGLDGVTGANNKWDRVEDFNWLRLQHSPNWSQLPAEQRKTFDVPPPS